MDVRHYLWGFIALACFMSITGCGLDHVDIERDFDKLPDYRYFPAPFEVFETTNHDLEIEDILSEKLQSEFAPLDSFIITQRQTTYWLRFQIPDTIQTLDSVVVYPGLFPINTLYYPKDSVQYQTSHAGNFHPLTHPLERVYWRYHLVDVGELSQQPYSYLKIRHPHHPTRITPYEIWTMAPKPFWGTTFNFAFYERPLELFMVFFIGGLTLLFLYFLGVYFIVNDQVFLWYTFYLLFIGLYLGVKLYPDINSYLFGNRPYNFVLWNELTQVFISWGYNRFVRTFLNAKEDYPLFNKVTIIMEWFLVAVAVAVVAVFVIDPTIDIPTTITYWERGIMVLFALWASTHVFINRKNNLVYYVILGSLFLLGGSLTALFLGHVRYFVYGVSIELFIFGLGLGYLLRERDSLRARLANEVERVKMMAFQSQMNPHFIFNSLNSIRSYMIKNETKAASDYLSKFSKLIRQILEFSAEESITLQQEMDVLTLYVHIEQLRFRDIFQFNIRNVGEVPLEEIKIPPMLLQPFVENAIWHGLMRKEGEKHIEIEIEQEHNELLFVVRDNGIGRAAAADKKRSGQLRKSMAIDLTTKRIELLQSSFIKKPVAIIDLFTADQQPAGTEVRVLLPIIR